MVGFSEIKRRVRTANPQGKTRSAAKRSGSKKARKQNPDLLTLGALVNPQGAKMAQKHKGKPKPQQKTKTAQKKRTGNPQALQLYRQQQLQKQRPAGKKKKRYGNPNLTGRTVQLLRNGALALGGLIATRQLPQMVLQAKNEGWIGYLSNVGVALGSATLAESMLRGSGVPVLIGGGLYVVDRILTEKFSSAGQILSLSGVGDAKVAVNGTRGLRGVRRGYFPLPVQYDASGQPIIPQAILDAAQAGMVSQASQAAAMAAAGGGVRGVRGAGINRAGGNRLLAA